MLPEPSITNAMVALMQAFVVSAEVVPGGIVAVPPGGVDP
jgi:hypothetical protein